ncbi:helix-turn-helix transcriptional regulator [Providencia rettgeri]|uniref:helix-turn-helix domain-containing protein n=1 Tax=Providencia rettgeri TaxID=587 RepID=UPI002446C944|nr:helix-turn-helix transcriptional regulator [Providencia rettgeri]MDH2379573.1 helix-turn-helix transcriptional regulator [Providencia rettgeri]MDR9616865.1 helix-turn-helix transcriptional regulator [Providencia rettgeri]MDW7803609.1 helix-turn-helix transcriptional regulator [Providencia rettgeri]
MNYYDKSLNKKIGLYLRSLRKERGLTEKELGAILNLSQQQVSKYETGTVKITFQLIDDIFLFYIFHGEVFLKNL